MLLFTANEMGRQGRAWLGRQIQEDTGKTKMALNHRSENAQEAPAEARIWQAVLLQAVEEWQSAPLRVRRKAEDFLFSDNTDFPLVCSAAGLDVSRMRAQLKKLRSQPVRAERPIAA
jgi:hypothetical protein